MKVALSTIILCFLQFDCKMEMETENKQLCYQIKKQINELAHV